MIRMSRTLIRWLIALTSLSVLWGYANSVGVTQAVSEATGYNIPSSFTLPFVDQKLMTGAKKVNPQIIAVESLKKAAREDLPAKSVEAAIEAAKKAGLSAQDIKDAYNESVEKSKREHALELEVLAGKPVVKEQPKKPAPAKTTPAPKKPAPVKTTPVKPSPKPSATSKPVAPKGNIYAAAIIDAKALTVKGRAAKTGYSRDQFGAAWTDKVTVKFGMNGCDTRNDILKRDLVDVKFASGTCKVATGTLAYEPYTGAKNVKFVAGGAYENQLDAEHIVALGDAWQKGAQQWSKEKRTNFANDPLNLMMVDPSSNRAKGDADAATWLPKNKSFRCDYVRGQIVIKKTYGLWVTKAEQDAMIGVLTPCAK